MPVGYTDIVGKFTRAVVDGPDSDRDPDRIPIEGLQFEFAVDLKPAIARDTVAKETVYLDPIPATTDANGVLIGPDGLPGIRLTASDSPDLEPNGWTYTVTTKGAGLPTVKTTFVTESGKTLDFSDIVAVPPNPGNQIPAWTAVVSQATTAAAEATEAKTVAVAAAESVQRDQPNGVAPLGADAKIPDAKLPARLADSALTAKIGEAISARLGAVSADDVFRALDMADPSRIVVACAGDSTGDSSIEWFARAWRTRMALTWPRRQAEYRQWVVANTAYDPAVQWQAGGTPARPEVPGTPTPDQDTFLDTFTRSVTDLAGTAPEYGAGSFAATSGTWSADGSAAVRIGSGSSVLLGRTTGKQTPDGVWRARVSADWSQGGTTTFRGAAAAQSQNHLQIALAPLTSAAQAKLQKNIAGTVTDLATFPADVIPLSVTALDLEIKIEGTSVTASVNGVQVTGVLSSSDVSTLTNALYIGVATALIGLRIDRMQATGVKIAGGSPAVPAVPADGGPLVAYNASVAGSTAEKQIEYLDQMFPERPDLLFINHGHNYVSTVTTEQYLESIDALVAAVRQKYDSQIPVVVLSQNPRFAPAPRVEQHRTRQIALRAHALNNGWGYIPSFEAFLAQPDGGVSFVHTDGVHPTGVADDMIPTGAKLQAETASGWLRSWSKLPD
ncbi:SGNH/GDSL hydrolase family protein [Microbacterium sp. 1P06AB]|uniref:SGNH/GDSL hydrolase family protein n=1 Tax=Microbacterium sp. 1P06AB TaxID=3132289 RepID=UPI0039A72B4B